MSLAFHGAFEDPIIIRIVGDNVQWVQGGDQLPDPHEEFEPPAQPRFLPVKVFP
jgi:hypothetical protein